MMVNAMFNSLTEYQKGATIVRVIEKGNDATVTMTLALMRHIPIVSDPSEAWLSKIPLEERVPRELAIQALEWERQLAKQEDSVKDDAFTVAMSVLYSAATIFLGHSPSRDELSQLLHSHEERLNKMEARNAFLSSFDATMRERRRVIQKSLQLETETPLSRLIREQKESPEGRAADELRRAEDKGLAASMVAVRAWYSKNDKASGRE